MLIQTYWVVLSFSWHSTRLFGLVNDKNLQKPTCIIQPNLCVHLILMPSPSFYISFGAILPSSYGSCCLAEMKTGFTLLYIIWGNTPFYLRFAVVAEMKTGFKACKHIMQKLGDWQWTRTQLRSMVKTVWLALKKRQSFRGTKAPHLKPRPWQQMYYSTIPNSDLPKQEGDGTEIISAWRDPSDNTVDS